MRERTRNSKWSVRGLALLCATIVFPGATVVVADNDPDARFRGSGKADPIRIENVNVKPAGENASTIALDLAWDWSWRAAWEVSPQQHGGKAALKLESWDAAWVFVKFRSPGSEWAHATLAAKAADHRVPGGAAIDVGLSDDGGRGLGVFVYRKSPGNGVSDFNGVKLRWLHTADGVENPRAVDLKVFAIQMVYVPQCPFWVGDGATDKLAGQFSAGDGDRPYRVDSERAITLGGEGPRNLGTRDCLGMSARAIDDFHCSHTRDLPEAFPKGYAAFYCMRHEMTQWQFVALLNMLPYEQQAALMDCKPSEAAGTFIAGPPSDGKGRNGIRIAAAGTAATSEVVVYRREPIVASATIRKSSAPAVFETLLPHVACNNITHRDGTVFAAWAGLRPMTELEFEKACRGPLTPVANEYAWGTDAIAGSGAKGEQYTLQNPGQPDEAVAWSGENGPDAVRGNALCSTNDMGTGALRVGIFATPDSDRVRAGASYWGILDMTGNLLEAAVPVGSAAGRTCAGTHGDGKDAPWRASVFGLRGGGQPYGGHAGLWGRDDAFRVSNRRIAVKPGPYNADKRHFSAGFRCVRTAPKAN